MFLPLKKKKTCFSDQGFFGLKIYNIHVYEANFNLLEHKDSNTTLQINNPKT